MKTSLFLVVALFVLGLSTSSFAKDLFETDQVYYGTVKKGQKVFLTVDIQVRDDHKQIVRIPSGTEGKVVDKWDQPFVSQEQAQGYHLSIQFGSGLFTKKVAVTFSVSDEDDPYTGMEYRIPIVDL